MSFPELAPTRPLDFTIDYGGELEEAIADLQEEINRHLAIRQQYPQRWLALRLLEQDEGVVTQLPALEGGLDLLAQAHLALARLNAIYPDGVDVWIAERRYTWIHSLTGRVVKRDHPNRLTLTDRVDRVVIHPLLGTPIFLGIMWVVFKLTADVSAPYLDWMDSLIGGPLTRWTVALLGAAGLQGTWVESLLVDGILAGVGGVVVFVPVLVWLYLALAILEGSGYMARAAFVMDRLMRLIGLHSKSFLPMLVGFGCSVPALYATRTLENEKSRILTGLLIPFMSCGARLPVYVLFATIFFPERAGLVIFGMYLTGVTVAVGLGWFLHRTIFRDQEMSRLVMELPHYQLPGLRNVASYVWERVASFLHSASTLVLTASVIVWLLMAIPLGGSGAFAQTGVDTSAFAALSRTVAPALGPLGFSNWQAAGSLVTGFVAKEVVISTLALTHGLEEDEEETHLPAFSKDLGEIGSGFLAATVDTVRLIPLIVGIDLSGGKAENIPTGLALTLREQFEDSSGGHGRLAALAFLVFVLIYTPCMVAVAAERQELGIKWMWISVVGQTVLAWLLAFVVFQGGILLGLG